MTAKRICAVGRDRGGKRKWLRAVCMSHPREPPQLGQSGCQQVSHGFVRNQTVLRAFRRKALRHRKPSDVQRRGAIQIRTVLKPASNPPMRRTLDSTQGTPAQRAKSLLCRNHYRLHDLSIRPVTTIPSSVAVTSRARTSSSLYLSLSLERRRRMPTQFSAQ
jgi:hypothetical protein